MNRRYAFQPDYAYHPGETVAETLDLLGMLPAEVAQRAGYPVETINEIIQGKTSITADIALHLEWATGVPARFWKNAQRNYEARKSKMADPRSNTAVVP